MNAPSASKPELFRVGAHVLWFESPDVVKIELHDPLTDEDIGNIVVWLDVIREQSGRFAAVVDVCGLHQMPRGVMSFSRSPGAGGYYRAIAFVGASFSVRVAVNIVLKAARLLSVDGSMFAYAFVATQDEASAWLSTLDKPPS